MQQPHGNNNGGAPQNGSGQGQGNVPPGFTYQQAYGMPGQPGAGGSMPMTQMDPSAQAQHQQQFMRQHLQQQQLAAVRAESPPRAAAPAATKGFLATADAGDRIGE